MEIEKLLSDLEDLIEGGSSVPWFGRRYVNEEDFHRLVNAIRHALPRSIGEAAEITTQRDRVLRQAQEQAREILDQAHAQGLQTLEEGRAQVASLVAQENVVREASIRAEEIIRQAHQEAAAVRAETQVWVAGLFSRLEMEMGRVADGIERSKTTMDAHVAPTPPAADPTQAAPTQPAHPA